MLSCSESAPVRCDMAIETYPGNITTIEKMKFIQKLTGVFAQSDGLQLQEVGDYRDENCLHPLNLIQSTKHHLTTEPPISCRCCYWFGILFCRPFSFGFKFCINVQTYKFSILYFTVFHFSFVIEVELLHCLFAVQVVCFYKSFNSMQS